MQQLVKDFEAADPDSLVFDTLFQMLRLAARTHMEQGVSTLFPLLERYADRFDRSRMGSSYRTAKAVAPTHPHPSAPHSPGQHRDESGDGRHRAVSGLAGPDTVGAERSLTISIVLGGEVRQRGRGSRRARTGNPDRPFWRRSGTSFQVTTPNAGEGHDQVLLR
ncbi:MAG: hypothetical protein ACLP62_09735 [Acidimicrobiales bacterium]